MSEETAGELGTEAAEGAGVEAAETHQPTIEEIARAIGYRDKSEMKDPTKHVDAAEYIKRTAKFNDSYRQEIKHLKRSIDGITATVSQVAAQKHAEGVKEAEARLAAAKAEFDPDAVEQATIALQNAKAAAPQTNAVPPEVDEWCERNPWFDTDKGMKADALEYRAKYLRANPDATISDTLEYIERKIRKDYPEAFTTAKKEDAPPRKSGPAAGPEGIGTGGNAKEPWEKFEKELNKTERDTMEALCGMMHNGKPVITKKQYIDNLAASGRFGR